MFVDSHAHIDGSEYDDDRDAVVDRARNAGVLAILNIGTGNPAGGNFERAVAVAERYEGIYVAVGIHPHDARLYTEDAEKKLLSVVNSSERVIGWGEIGLDYFYDNSPRAVQHEVFARQLRLARNRRLPVIIHSRDADRETVDVLREGVGESALTGMMHCFGGDERMAEDVLSLGFMISFAGNVTFKKADALREVAKQVPLDRLLIETDCPFLTPVPFRGRRNEPAHVVETARCLAELRGIDLTELGRVTTANFSRLFGVSFD